MSWPAPQLKITYRETSPSRTKFQGAWGLNSSSENNGTKFHDIIISDFVNKFQQFQKRSFKTLFLLILVRGGANDKSWKYPSEAEIVEMIETRNLARKARNFKEADRLREELRIRGIALWDTPGARGKGTEVTTWRYCR